MECGSKWWWKNKAETGNYKIKGKFSIQFNFWMNKEYCQNNRSLGISYSYDERLVVRFYTECFRLQSESILEGSMQYG